MNKERFYQLVNLLSKDENGLNDLPEEDRRAFQQELINRGYELPKFGADGDIGDETKTAFLEFAKSDEFAGAVVPSVNSAENNDGNTDTPDNNTGDGNTGNAWANRLDKVAQENKIYADNKAAADNFNREKGLAQRDVYNAGLVGTDLARLGSALSQIKTGKQQQEDAVRPTMPMREVSPELSGAYQRSLANTGRGFTDAERAGMSSLDLAALSNSLKSVGALNAGQSSVAGVGAQQIHNNMIKENLRRGVADAQARQANDAYTAQTGQALARDKDSLFRSQLQFGYMPALKDYRNKMRDAMLTEQQGRVNMDNLLSVAPYRSANLVKDYYGGGVSRGTETPLEREKRLADRKTRRREFFTGLSDRLRKPQVIQGDGTFDDGTPIYDLPDYNPPLDDIMNDPYANPQYTV